MRNSSITLQYWANIANAFTPNKAIDTGSDIALLGSLGAVANSEFQAPVQLVGAPIKAAWPNPYTTQVRAGVKMPIGVAIGKFTAGTDNLVGYASNLVKAEVHHGFQASLFSNTEGQGPDFTQYLMGPFGNQLLNVGVAYKDSFTGDVSDVPPSILSSIQGQGKESKIQAVGMTLDSQYPYHQKTSFILDPLGPISGSVITAHGTVPIAQQVTSAQLALLAPDFITTAGTGSQFIQAQAAMVAKFGIQLDARIMDNEYDRNNDLYIIIAAPASSCFCAPDAVYGRGPYSCPNNTPTLTSWGAYYGPTDVVVVPLTYLKRSRSYTNNFSYASNSGGVAADLVLNRTIGTATWMKTAIRNGVSFSLGDVAALPLSHYPTAATDPTLVGPFA